MADYTREVLKLLSDNGCYFLRRGKGSHKVCIAPSATDHSPWLTKSKTDIQQMEF